MTEIEKAKHAIKIIMTAEPDAEKAAEVALVAIAHALIAIAEQLENRDIEKRKVAHRREKLARLLATSGEEPWERHEDGT